MASDDSKPNGTTATTYQVVAYNLRRAREERGMSRKELSESLGNLTGSRWTPTTLSQAENTWSSNPVRVRHFDVNEVLAFSLALDVPIPWFFLPPPAQPTGYPPSSDSEKWITTTDAAGDCLSIPELAARAVPRVKDLAEKPNDLMLPRLRTELREFEPVSPTASAARLRRFKQRVVEAVEELDEGS